ncbi:MAG: AAA family ATPase, partial [Caldilineaceae bacterium]|nr:AAA family ATPase [Caldilineaceae bacterium]
MITSIHIQNYRSIVDATAKLAPFTLLIGANGTGKSNFLQLLESIGSQKHT